VDYPLAPTSSASAGTPWIALDSGGPALAAMPLAYG